MAWQVLLGKVYHTLKIINKSGRGSGIIEVMEAKVRGFEWTREGQIIAAMVLRLGGEVELTIKELCAAEGLIIGSSLDAEGVLRLEATFPTGETEIALDQA